MDRNFIRRATKITSFNLTSADFQSLKYKKEIQHLFGFYFFDDFDIATASTQQVNAQKFNSLITILKNINKEQFKYVHNYNLKGIGPGEVTLYLLCQSAYLGGGSSAGVDLVAGNEKYEVKAVKISADNIASDFKLGGTVSLSKIITDLNDLRISLRLGGTTTEMSGSIINQMKKMAPKEFAKVESAYAALAEEYFDSHKTIFINNSSSLDKMGRIEAIKRVSKNDIMIDRVTSGTVKPKIKL